MSTKISTTEIITLTADQPVYGLSLTESELPFNFDSLGRLWGIYEEKYRTGEPAVEYGVCLNNPPDYIVGAVAPKDSSQKSSFVIPSGSYVKDTFSADSFEELSGAALLSRDVPAWAAAHGVTLNKDFDVEVYDWASFAKGEFVMYTLTPIVQK